MPTSRGPGRLAEVQAEGRIRGDREDVLQQREAAVDIEAQEALDQRLAAHARLRAETRDVHGQEPDPVDQREADRVQQGQAGRHPAEVGSGDLQVEPVAGEAAEEVAQVGGEPQPVEGVGDHHEFLAPAVALGAPGPLQPHRRVEGVDIRAQHVEVGDAGGVLHQAEGPGEAHGIPAHVAEQVWGPARRTADAVQGIGQEAELLQDRVVGDRPHLARMGDHGRAAAVGLAGDGPGARAVEEARAEGPEQGGVAGIVDQRLHVLAHHGEELGGEIRLGVDRVVGLVGPARGIGQDIVGEAVVVGDIEGEDVLGDALHRGLGQGQGAEHQVAVRALEARFEAHAGCPRSGCAGANPRARDRRGGHAATSGARPGRWTRRACRRSRAPRP